MISDFYGMDDIFKKESLGYLNECESVFEELRDLSDNPETTEYDKEKIKKIKNSLFKVKKSSMMLDITYIVDFINDVEKKINLILNDKVAFSPDFIQSLEIAKSQIGYMIEFYTNNSTGELEPKLQKIAANVLNKLETLSQDLQQNTNVNFQEISEENVAQEHRTDKDETHYAAQAEEEPHESLEIPSEEFSEISPEEVTQNSLEQIQEVGNDFFGESDKTTQFAHEFLISNIDEVKASFIEKLETEGDFVVNFSSVSAIDTAGIQVILAMKKYCDTEGVEFKINNPSTAVSSWFEELNLEL